MTFENSEYRANLARVLKEHPRSRRLEILAVEKTHPDYLKARDGRDFARRNYMGVKKLEQLVDAANGFEDLIAGLSGTEMYIFNPSMKGVDQSQHLLKRLDLARRFGDISLLPVAGGLRAKVAELMVAEGKELVNKFDPELYKSYLQQREGDCHFTDEELQRITSKVSPDVFCSLDTDIEDSILLFNALEGVTTAFSCAGHLEAIDESGISMLVDSSYVSFKANDEQLAGYLNDAMVEETDSHEIFLTQGNNGNFNLCFRIRVPERWKQQNNRKADAAIFEASKRQLEEILGPSELWSVSFDYYIDHPSGFYAALVSLQNKFLLNNPQEATAAFAHNRFFLQRIYTRTPDYLLQQENKDYYLSEEANQSRQSFLTKLANVLKDYRRMVT